MRTRNIVLITVGGCAGLVLATVGSLWLLYSLLTARRSRYEPPPPPAKLKEARVVIGQGFLSRTVFFETGLFKPNKDIGDISDVRVGEFDSHPGLDVVVAADYGAIVFDRDGVNQGLTIFRFPTVNENLGPFTSEHTDRLMGQRLVVDLEGDGVCEYIANGSTEGAAVFDHQGKLLWTYGKFTKERTSIDNLTIGDLDGDGVAELVVSWNGIEVFDKSGKRKSQVTEEYGDDQIEVVDTDWDGKNEIVSLTNTLKIRNAAGQVTKEVDMPGYFGHFDLCNMPGTQEPVMLTVYESQLLLIDFKGDTVAKFKAPLSEFDDTVYKAPDGSESRGTSVYKSRGLWIKLANDRPEYLAVINEFAAIDRSVLDVYTPTGQLVYQEVLPEQCQSIAVLPPADASGVQELLVGGANTVWRYRLN